MLAPTCPVVAPPIGVDDTVHVNGVEHPLFPTVTRNVAAPTVVGLPMVSLPAGFGASGLQVGVNLEGQPFDDARLAIAEVLEVTSPV